jgi:hypothetical protein
MPNRIILGDLMTSPRYWSCTPLARNLYLSILLSADDLGCPQRVLPAHPLPGRNGQARDVPNCSRNLSTDLVRPYEVEQNSFHTRPEIPAIRSVRARTTQEPPAEIGDLTPKKQC